MPQSLLGGTVEYHEITQCGQCVCNREFGQIPLTCKTGKLSTHGDVSVPANKKICDPRVHKVLYLTQSNYLRQCSYKATSWISEAKTKDIFSSAKCPNRMWVPPSLLSRYEGQSGPVVELTTLIKNTWSYTSTPHMISWHAQGQRYFCIAKL
jgi:hypothetical protein